mgnify:FL=1|tara:strand:- start:5054 stop:6496 length:1443 start_codon:yes stop_codon:yes gene_type:complete
MRLNAIINKILKERQVIVSTRGELRYLKLSVSAQAMGLVVGVGFIGMFSYFLVGGALQYQQMTEAQAKILSLQASHDALAADFSLAQSTIAATQGELDQQYARLEEILANRKETAEALDLAADSGEDTLEGRIRTLGESLHQATARREQLELEVMQLNKTIFQTTRMRDEASANSAKTEQKLVTLRKLVNLYASTREDIYRELEDSRRQHAALKQEVGDRVERESQLTAEVTDLRQRMTRMSSNNKNLLARIHDRTNENVAALREIILLTGLDPDKLLDTDGENIGQGGPFMAPRPEGRLLVTERDFYAQTEKMEASLARWQSLQTLLQQLPLARPVDVGYVTSSFGKRHDPMTKRSAFHSGLDMAGPKNASVIATAPGVVTFAGHNGAYGVMVTIDHGYGFQTRYAHLKKATVKKGDKIDYRTKIGVMGSTGRSTGRHVHYEIMYDGEHLDPAKFIQAGRYAFKATPKLEKAELETSAK